MNGARRSFRMRTMRKDRSRVRARILISSTFAKTRSAPTQSAFICTSMNEGKAHIRMTLGPEVQTLTRAMTAILCKGLDGSTPQEILDLPSDFVTRIVGTELVRAPQPDCLLRPHADKKHLQSLAGPPAHGASGVAAASWLSGRARQISCQLIDGRVNETSGSKPGGRVNQAWMTSGAHLLRDVRVILFVIARKSCAKITSK